MGVRTPIHRLLLVTAITLGSFALASTSTAAERVYFPSHCNNLAFRPRTVIVACGDGNFQLRKMHWRRWNRHTALGSGLGYVNDCQPACYLGHFHYYPVTVRLYEPHRCYGSDGALQFRKLSYTFQGPYPYGRSGKVPFQCADEAAGY
jgi:hypothetical protein